MKRVMRAFFLLGLVLSMGMGQVHAAKKAVHKASRPAMLLRWSGKGNRNSKYFRAPSPWYLDYHYSCAAYGSPGNLTAILWSNPTAMVSAPVNVVGTGGKGQVTMHIKGRFYLQVASQCAWSFVATAARPSSSAALQASN